MQIYTKRVHVFVTQRQKTQDTRQDTKQDKHRRRVDDAATATATDCTKNMGSSFQFPVRVDDGRRLRLRHAVIALAVLSFQDNEAANSIVLLCCCVVVLFVRHWKFQFQIGMENGKWKLEQIHQSTHCQLSTVNWKRLLYLYQYQ
jgi:hypothetical protein